MLEITTLWPSRRCVLIFRCVALSHRFRPFVRTSAAHECRGASWPPTWPPGVLSGPEHVARRSADSWRAIEKMGCSTFARRTANECGMNSRRPLLLVFIQHDSTVVRVLLHSLILQRKSVAHVVANGPESVCSTCDQLTKEVERLRRENKLLRDKITSTNG